MGPPVIEMRLRLVLGESKPPRWLLDPISRRISFLKADGGLGVLGVVGVRGVEPVPGPLLEPTSSAKLAT